MVKPSKHQKQYKKRKKDGGRDFRRTVQEDGRGGRRVTRSQLCVRVSLEASQRLLEVSREHQETQQDMLTWMLLKGLPKYSSLNDDPTGLVPYKWKPELLNPENREVKYKGTKGQKQLNLAITSTASKKLECHKTATGYSKARIVQTLILNYRFLTEAGIAANKRSEEKNRLSKDGYREETEPPTLEQIQRCKEELDRILDRREEVWDEICDDLKEGYKERLSQNEEEPSD